MKDDFNETGFWAMVAFIYFVILVGVYEWLGKTAFFIACGLLVGAAYAVWFLFMRGKK